MKQRRTQRRKPNPDAGTIILLLAGAVVIYIIYQQANNPLYQQANNPLAAYVNPTLPLVSPTQQAATNAINASIVSAGTNVPGLTGLAAMGSRFRLVRV